MKLVVEDIVADPSRRYCERLGEEGSIGVLLGGLSDIPMGTAEIYYLHPQGYGHQGDTENSATACAKSGLVGGNFYDDIRLVTHQE